MQAAFDSISLKPPRPGRWSMPMVLAVAAHLLLIAALTWGVHWKQDAQPQTFEAELWSAVAQKAAPREVVPPPPPPPKVEAKVEPKVEPKPTPPTPKPKVEPAPPDTREADIAIAQAKKKKEEAEKREADKKAAKEKADKEKAEKLEKDKKAKALEKEELKKQAAADDAKQKALDEKKSKAAAERADAAAAKVREEQMRRIMGQAGATGDAKATGTAQRSSGPSPGYAGRVIARIKPNVLFTDDIAGNPKSEVEVTTAPDGTIISRRLAKSSGNPDWDKAALAAIDRTGTLPRDVDGRVPSPMIVELRPRD